MSILDIKKDLWRSTKLDSYSISAAFRLRRRCGQNNKVIFFDGIPLVVPKTKMDRFLERTGLRR